jgi:hypothetical protein
MRTGLLRLCLFCAGSSIQFARGADCPQWGGYDARNMVSEETGLPNSFSPGKKNGDETGLDLATARNVKWVAKLGDQTYGTPTVAGGRVFIGTNNGSPRDNRFQGDRSVQNS